jgi:phosphate-selective porin OprO and OprP
VLHRTSRRVAVLACAVLCCCAPAAAAQVAIPLPPPAEGTPPRLLSLTLGGVVEARYEFLHTDAGEELSSFLLRRARVDVQGAVFDPRLTFRIMPELARTASMRDAWIDFAFTPAARVRLGQFTVPFQWHRHVSARAQHFAERGAPSEAFGFPDGRDVGVMLHGRNARTTLEWGVGVFDGAGRNVARSHSSGNMASGRLGVALAGTLPREEVDLLRSPRPQLSVGVGAQAASRNEAGPWALGRAEDERADWATGTADLQLRWRGVSLATEGYLRGVRPRDAAVGAYTGAGALLSGGYTVLPGRLDVVARWSTLRLDRDDPGTAHEQWGIGVNVYHSGHDVKTRIQYLHDRAGAAGDDPAVRSGVLLVEQRIGF